MFRAYDVLGVRVGSAHFSCVPLKTVIVPYFVILRLILHFSSTGTTQAQCRMLRERVVEI